MSQAACSIRQVGRWPLYPRSFWPHWRGFSRSIELGCSTVTCLNICPSLVTLQDHRCAYTSGVLPGVHHFSCIGGICLWNRDRFFIIVHDFVDVAQIAAIYLVVVLYVELNRKCSSTWRIKWPSCARCRGASGLHCRTVFFNADIMNSNWGSMCSW